MGQLLRHLLHHHHLLHNAQETKDNAIVIGQQVVQNVVLTMPLNASADAVASTSPVIVASGMAPQRTQPWLSDRPFRRKLSSLWRATKGLVAFGRSSLLPGEVLA